MSEAKRRQYKFDSLRAGDEDVVRLRFTFPKKNPRNFSRASENKSNLRRLTHVF